MHESDTLKHAATARTEGTTLASFEAPRNEAKKTIQPLVGQTQSRPRRPRFHLLPRRASAWGFVLAWFAFSLLTGMRAAQADAGWLILLVVAFALMSVGFFVISPIAWRLGTGTPNPLRSPLSNFALCWAWFQFTLGLPTLASGPLAAFVLLTSALASATIYAAGTIPSTLHRQLRQGRASP